jgi:C1A family cysteine protease
MPVKKVVAPKKSKPKSTRYGWVPDVPDQRDYLLSAVLRVPAKLPPLVDLRPLCSKVEDQEQLGSCTANALAGGLEFLERKDKIAFEDFSRLFIYYNERAVEHTIQSDSGAMIRDGIKTLAKQGVCSEKKWPYVVSKFRLKPIPACY